MRSLLIAILLLVSQLASYRVSTAGVVQLGPNRNVTFLSTSDPHFVTSQKQRHNDWNCETIEQMNKITDVPWPADLGGGKIDKPRGVLVLGDCIDDGDRRDWSAEQYGHFLRAFGLDGTDGLMKYPAFEGWGNHDGPPIGAEKQGFSFQSHLKQRNAIRVQKGLVSNVSDNGLHYSWDWDDVHFVQLNLYPADRQNAKVHYSPVWHDPQDSLTFMKQDLAKHVGRSGRPVVLMAHCGFDTDWWIEEDWEQAYQAAKSYNVVLYLYGHTGTGVRRWAPAGETPKWTCINDGNTTAGFFVVQIRADRLRAAYRTRTNVKYTKATNGQQERSWDGSWGWKWPLRVEISRGLATGAESSK